MGIYPRLCLHHLQRVGGDGRRQAGRHPEEEGVTALDRRIARPDPQLKLQQLALQKLIGGELDGRIGNLKNFNILCYLICEDVLG